MCCKGVAILYSCFDVTVMQCGLTDALRAAHVLLCKFTTLQVKVGKLLRACHVLLGRFDPVLFHYHTTTVTTAWVVQRALIMCCRAMQSCTHSLWYNKDWVFYWLLIMCYRGIAILYTFTTIQQVTGGSLRAFRELLGNCNPTHNHYLRTVHWALIMWCRENTILYSCSSVVSNQHVPAKQASVSSTWEFLLCCSKDSILYSCSSITSTSAGHESQHVIRLVSSSNGQRLLGL